MLFCLLNAFLSASAERLFDTLGEQLVVLCSIDAGAKLHVGKDKQLLDHKLLKHMSSC